MSFTVAKLESLIVNLLKEKGIGHLNGKAIARDEVYKEIFEQPENFKKYQG